MALPKGLQEPRRVGFLIPIVIALVVVASLAVVAWSHLAAKGPGQHKDADAAQVATSQTPPTRDAYNVQDYIEPNAK